MSPQDAEGLTNLLVRIGQTSARFELGEFERLRKCISCVRKRYSFPDTCDEGWDRMRAGKDAGGCVNWIGWDELAGRE